MSTISEPALLNEIMRYSIKKVVKKLLLYLLTVIIIAITIFPFYWLISTSLKYGKDVQTFPPIIFPLRYTTNNYIEIFTKTSGIGRNLFNSIIIAVSTTILAVLFGSMAAYSLAKTYIGQKVRHALLIVVLIMRIFPPVVTAMPYFLIMTKLNLFDTQIALIITYVAFSMPFVMWLMLGFFQELPQEIEKAAIMDGCTIWQRFSKVTLPLAIPGLAVTAVFCFILSWSEFLYASVLTSMNARTLPVVVSNFMTGRVTHWGPMTAIGVMMVIPVLLFSIFILKYLVRGLTFGAVKG
jgi:multiple sugar transport system permease protein